MNEHDKKEVMNLIKIKEMIKAGGRCCGKTMYLQKVMKDPINYHDVRMIYPQKWDFEDVEFKKEMAFKEEDI